MSDARREHILQKQKRGHRLTASDLDYLRDSREEKMRGRGLPPKRDREAISRQECTRDPIFLFQRKRWIYTGVPDGYGIFDEGICAKVAVDGEPLFSNVEDGEYLEILTEEELSQRHHGDHDLPCCLERWDTELVFHTREAGVEYGTNRSYNYPDGWRVYCVCAMGDLATILNDHDSEETND